MKDAAFEMQRLAGYSNSFLTSAQRTKIFNRFRSFIYKELKDDTSNCKNKYKPAFSIPSFNGLRCAYTYCYFTFNI